MYSISYVKYVTYTYSLYPTLHTLVALYVAMAVAMAGAKAMDVFGIFYTLCSTLYNLHCTS